MKAHVHLGSPTCAVGSGQFRGQPLFELATSRLEGFEALARWTHPEHGVVGPDLFIPIAEESGLIVPLTDFVLKRACQQLKDWQLADATFSELWIVRAWKDAVCCTGRLRPLRARGRFRKPRGHRDMKTLMAALAARIAKADKAELKAA